MKSARIKRNMQESIISTIFQRIIQYISDINDIPWETDKHQKENKDDNNQYTYYHSIYIIISSPGQIILRHILSQYLHTCMRIHLPTVLT